jgi:hypothetical protein
MKVDKRKFDNLLGKMLKTPPEPEKGLVIKGKAGKVIPPTPRVPHKA